MIKYILMIMSLHSGFLERRPGPQDYANVSDRNNLIPTTAANIEVVFYRNLGSVCISPSISVSVLRYRF